MAIIGGIVGSVAVAVGLLPNAFQSNLTQTLAVQFAGLLPVLMLALPSL